MGRRKPCHILAFFWINRGIVYHRQQGSRGPRLPPLCRWPTLLRSLAMAKTQRPSGAYQNRLLAKLQSTNSDGFFRHLQPIGLAVRKALHEPGRRVKFAYFVEAGMVSV